MKMAEDSDNSAGAARAGGNRSATFSLFAELRLWSPSLPRWQQLALHMLLEKGSVDEEDLKVIYAALLVDNGLAEMQEVLEFQELSSYRIPESPGSEHKVVLKGIRHIEGVNALAEDQTIGIGPQLTVVYGPTGSGKSGFARILKDSCFTRSKDRGILGNVYLPPSKRPTPCAVLTVAVDGKEHDLSWQPGAPLPVLRDYFSVFDTSCTRVNIDEQNVFVTPYGFDVFPGLVTVCKQLRDILEQEIAERTPKTDLLVPTQGASRVSELLAGLSEDTPIDELERLAAFGEDERRRLLAVQKEIVQLQKEDLAAETKRFETIMTDLRLVEQKCQAVASGLGDTIVATIRGLAVDLGKLQELAEVAYTVQFAEEPVQPVGSDTWRQLVHAAVAFSAEAYPDTKYPADVQDARCVLCQQPLGPDALARLSRFIEVVRSDVEQRVGKKRLELEGAYAELGRVDLDFFAPEAACRRSLDHYHTGLATQVAAFIAEAKVRRDRVFNAATEEDWAAVPALPETVCPALSEEIADVGRQIAELKEADAVERTETLLAEQQLLIHREYLSKVMEDVKKAVHSLVWVANAREVSDGISHRHITEKNKALINKLAGQSFLPELRTECEKLGVAVPLIIQITASLGETSRRLGLNGTSYPEVPSEVLSEGEQRAIAMADLLTEVQIAGDIAGLVFDDPVCSLDNERKQKIAARLVGESKRRQVVVFTHDVIFAHHLVAAADGKAIDYVLHTMSRGATDGRPGHVDEAVFPHLQCEGRALQKAEACLREAREASAKSREEKLLVGCGFLRTAYEDFVQHDLLGNTVRRWDERICYRLSDVYFDEDIAQRTQARMEFLSRHIDAHSHSIEFGERPLSVDLLAEEIQLFRKVKGDYRERRKERKKGEKSNEAN